MKVSILSFLLLLSACGIFETEDHTYINRFENDDLIISVTNGTLTKPPELEISNKTGQILYVHQQFISGCKCASYHLSVKTGLSYANLKYNETKLCWEIGVISVVCEQYFPPVEIDSLNTYTETVIPVLWPGFFELGFIYSFAENTKFSEMQNIKVSCEVR